MLNKCRKGYGGVITLHKPLPPHLRHHMSPRNVGKKSSSSSSSSSSSEEECLNVTSVTQKSSRVVTHPGSEGDEAHAHSHSSVKHLQEFLSERRAADAIVQPLLDTENGFIEDLERFLNHRDVLSLRKRELQHKRWTECVWWPIQRSIERRFARRRCEGAELTKGTHPGYDYCAKVSTSPLKDPLFLYSHSRRDEMRAVLYCQTGCADRLMEQNRSKRVSSTQQRQQESRTCLNGYR